MTPPQHLFFYSKKGIKLFLERFGFKVIKIETPWKFVPLSLIVYQMTQRINFKVKIPKVLNRISLPINLFDTMTIIAEKIKK